MSSWLFDPRPMLEWRMANLDSIREDPLPKQHLASVVSPRGSSARFPSDPLVRCYDYVDHNQRKYCVAYVKCGENPVRSAQLVDQCWVRGIPVILWFSEAPDRRSPFWVQILSSRSIERPAEGRLRWQPVLSWTCDRPVGFVRALSRWFRLDEPIFPPPLVRVAFAENLRTCEACDVVEGLASSAPLCRFKIFSLPFKWRKGFDVARWGKLLDSFYEDPSTCRDRQSQIIDLFPKGQAQDGSP